MKRAGRIVYRLLSGLSLLLLLATAGVWVRSYWVSDDLRWYHLPEDRSILDEKGIWSSRGGIRFTAWRYLSWIGYTIDDVHFDHNHKPATKYPSFGDDLLLNFSPEPRRYAALGCCINCGYDLRASSGRCPECGRERPAASQLTRSAAQG